jgi:hypothetical protein
VTVTDDCGLPERPIVVQDPKPGTLLGPGSYVITVSAVDAQGNIGTCETVFEVVDPTPLTLQCPQDILVTDCNSSQGTVVRFEVIAKGRCGNVPVQVTSTPPSGSVFAEGETVVTSTAKDSQGITYTCSFKVVVHCGGGAVIAAVHNANNQVVLTWEGGAVLEQASAVTGPWTSVNTQQGTFTVTPTGQKAFFRLRLP